MWKHHFSPGKCKYVFEAKQTEKDNEGPENPASDQSD